jgi:hypothetical protein
MLGCQTHHGLRQHVAGMSSAFNVYSPGRQSRDAFALAQRAPRPPEDSKAPHPPTQPRGRGPPLLHSVSPLHPGQALPLRLLLPVRPGIGTDDPAAGAHHPRPERRHRDVIRPAIGAQHHLVVAIPARHVERPHAELSRMLPSVIGSIGWSKRGTPPSPTSVLFWHCGTMKMYDFPIRATLRHNKCDTTSRTERLSIVDAGYSVQT